MKLYHATDRAKIASVMENGLNARSCLTNNFDQALYYAETIEDEGCVSTIVELDLDALVASVGDESLIPDHPSISEPITTTLDLSEDEVHEAWEACEGTWRDSLEIVNSLVCTVPIPAALLSCGDYEELPKSGMA
jgi:hypothetical protein